MIWPSRFTPAPFLPLCSGKSGAVLLFVSYPHRLAWEYEGRCFSCICIRAVWCISSLLCHLSLPSIVRLDGWRVQCPQHVVLLLSFSFLCCFFQPPCFSVSSCSPFASLSSFSVSSPLSRLSALLLQTTDMHAAYLAHCIRGFCLAATALW